MTKKKESVVIANNREVVAKTANAIVSAADMSEWGERKISETSIIVPRILKMELMSDKVKSQDAKFGQLRDSLTEECYGDFDTPIQILPITAEEKWAIYELDSKGKREYKEIIPVTPQNEHWKYKEGNIERDRIIDVYCLLAGDIEALPEDWESRGLTPLPKIVGFRRTSLRAGKKLYTQMYVTNRSKGLPPPGTVMEVSNKEQDGKEGTYGVLDVKPLRAAAAVEMKLALYWFKAIKGGKAKGDDSELKATEEVSVGDVKDY